MKNQKIHSLIFSLVIVMCFLGCSDEAKKRKQRTDELFRDIDKTLLGSSELLLYLDRKSGKIDDPSRLAEVEARRKKVPLTEETRDYNLIEDIKRQMHNPKSFEHIYTRYKPDPVYGKDYLIAEISFFGTNAYGGVVRQRMTVRISQHGLVLDEISE